MNQLDDFWSLLGDWVTTVREIQAKELESGDENPVWYVRKAMAVLTWWNDNNLSVSTINPTHKEQFASLMNYLNVPPLKIPQMAIGSIEQLSQMLKGRSSPKEGRIGERSWRYGGVDIHDLHGGVPMEIMDKMWGSPDGELFEVRFVDPPKVAEKINQNLRLIAKKSGKPMTFRAAYLQEDQSSPIEGPRTYPVIRRVVIPLSKGDSRGE